MKIQICSDLHLEFKENREWFKHKPLIPKGDILIIAGDTYYLNRNYAKLDFIKKVADDFEMVYLIPGNHEYYEGYDVSAALVPFEKKIAENVILLNNTSVEIKNVRFIFSTFWSKIEKNILPILRGMVDFRRIKFAQENFTINHYNALHDAAFEFVSNEVKKSGKKIIVSHHLPSEQCNIEEFKFSPLNEAFCVDKTNFIFDHDIDYWIYGHSHRNLEDFKIGNTSLTTNQFGYIGRNEHRFFDYEKVIQID